MIILDFNANKLFAKVEKLEETFLIDLNGIAKDEIANTTAMITRYNKKDEAADVSQYEHLTQARIYRQITMHLADFFKVQLGEKKIDFSKMYIDIIVACEYVNGNARLNMTDVEVLGVVKQFFSGTKGIGLTISQQAPKYDIKLKEN